MGSRMNMDGRKVAGLQFQVPRFQAAASSQKTETRNLRPLPSGVTLIMVAAVLSILAAMATGFYTLMLMQTKSAMRYGDTVRAGMLARAGISFGIAQLRAQALQKIEDPTAPWFMYNYLDRGKRYVSYPDSPRIHDGQDQDGDGVADNWEEARWGSDWQSAARGYSKALSNSGNNPLDPSSPSYPVPGRPEYQPPSDRFSLGIADAASKININAGDNLAVVLDNLCRAIGPPLAAADQKYLAPRVWEWYGGTQFNTDSADWPKAGTPGLPPPGPMPKDTFLNIYYWLFDSFSTAVWKKLGDPDNGRPRLRPDGSGKALYGEGYAIAGWRARNGKFRTLEQVKQALTYVERNNNSAPDDPLEQLELETKFQALRDYITLDSWVDTNTVCVGKFEWVYQSGSSAADPYDYAIDRDKSWIPDDPVNDPTNTRGSLRGCYLAILNGHGAGQLRRIRTNGIDWVQLDIFRDNKENWTGFTVPPGPISSYMIFAPENAKLVDQKGKDLAYTFPDNPPWGKFAFPKTDASGNIVPAVYPDGTPKIDYSERPLCFHRAPVNLNTASDKVLTALFLGLNVTQGNYLSLGTDVDINRLAAQPQLKSRYKWQPGDPDWKIKDYDDPNRVYRTVEPYILTPKGLKRIPADAGYLTLSRPKPWPAADDSKFSYIINYGNLGSSGTLGTQNFTISKDTSGNPYAASVAHELAYRIIVARQSDPAQPALRWIDPKTGWPSNKINPACQRGPFHSWDDFYFRVIRPWDDQRLDPKSSIYDPKAGSVARLILAHFNPNADILKFNPNIEWIDRWGRNFTEMEPVMVYTNEPEKADGQSLLGHGPIDGEQWAPFTICDQDPSGLTANSVPVFSRERLRWQSGYSQYFVCGVFGTDPKWMGNYVVRNFRYKSDEMIDKTDLNRSTTEFCFDSHGIFEIQSTGQIVVNNTVASERKVQALVKIYDVWTESTQRQFAQGHISRATGATGTPQAGQITRDSTNGQSGTVSRLALVTLPEPLVPINYTLKFFNPGQTKELVDTQGNANSKRDAWGNLVPLSTPLIVANRVQPAGYDGQIVLATNTQRFDAESANSGGDCDTFLASFNGDLDTETCLGNGHEQAKSPLDCTVQVEHPFGLLGALDDTVIASDPGLKGPELSRAESYGDQSGNNHAVADQANPPNSNNYPGATPMGASLSAPMEIYRYQTARVALRGLRPDFYWDNVTCRQGDLRTDGLYVGGPGMAGNTGVVKYECGSDSPGGSIKPGQIIPDNLYNAQNMGLNGKGATKGDLGISSMGTSGADTDSIHGFLLSMWAKTTWHHNDHRGHEFFQCGIPGWADGGIRSKAFWFRKMGGPQYAVMESGTLPGGLTPFEDWTWGVSGCGNRINDLNFTGEWQQTNGDIIDPDYVASLGGGISGVVPKRLDKTLYPATYMPESPSYYFQPFRWHFLGMRLWLKQEFSKCTNVVGGLTAPHDATSAGKSGYLKAWQSPDGWSDNNTAWLTQNIMRPFIDSERWSETGGQQTYDWHGKYWICHQVQGSSGFSAYQAHGGAGPIASQGGPALPVRYSWASPGGNQTVDGDKIYNHPIFGLNISNPGRGYYDTDPGDQSYSPSQYLFSSIYRGSIEEGTQAVIDEYKISRKETVLDSPPNWRNDRITRTDPGRPGEMTLSRYYLPQDPSQRVQCPTFTSQTMLQSLKGSDKKTNVNPQYVTLARVSWNCFTPRFLHEYKAWGKGGTSFQRTESITTSLGTQGGDLSTGQVPNTMTVPFRGPFNYWVYNDIAVNNGDASRIDARTLKAEEYEDYNDPAYDGPDLQNLRKVVPYRCNRPTPGDYQTTAPYSKDKNYHASKGVEIEVLQDQDADPGNGNETPLGAKSPYTNPDVLNSVLDAQGNPIRVRTDRLRYRVRFRYPVDKLADPSSPLNTVDPNTQFLLDTPVFDDISITYFTKPEILDYKDVTE